jgi:hypothetical protein
VTDHASRAPWFITFLVALLLVLASGVSCEDSIDRALAKIGLSKETARIDWNDMSNYGGDEFLLPIFKTLHQDPYKIPHYVASFREALQQSAGSIHDLVGFCSARQNEGVRRGWITQPIEQWQKKSAEPDSLLGAIKAVMQKEGQPISKAEHRKLSEACATVPPDIAESAALIIYTALDVLQWRDLAFSDCGDEKHVEKLFERLAEGAEIDGEDHFDPELYHLMKNCDLKFLNAGAADLAEATQDAAKALSGAKIEGDFEFEWETPMGWIALGGSGDDVYRSGRPYLLIIDTGGNDTYEGGAGNLSYNNPVSVAIDLSGDDSYRAPKGKGRCFGAGLMGYGYLIDCAGNDTYEAERFAQGAASFGVGALIDMAGNDHYTVKEQGQASSLFGIGILSDLGGDDRYDCYTESQSYAWTKGCSVLIDLEGSDQYVANDTDIIYPSVQSQEHNISLAQGTAFGRRADITDGHSFAGGFAMLLDASGDDKYSAGVFAQGCSYWYSVGILADSLGNDQYHGAKYDQGVGAHFGVAFQWDGAGDDTYTTDLAIAEGVGHDFTVGYFIDESGNDTYLAPDLSLGAGNANGIGIFWDKAGDDIYKSNGTTLGLANIDPASGLRTGFLSLGVFCDSGGEDVYPEEFRADCKDDSVWIDHGRVAAERPKMELGVGLDENSGPQEAVTSKQRSD